MKFTIEKPKTRAEIQIEEYKAAQKIKTKKLSDEIRKEKKILADFEKFKADHEKKLEKLAKIKAAEKTKIAKLKSQIEAQREEFDDEIEEFGTTFSVTVRVDASFQASGYRDQEDEYGVEVTIVNDADGSVEKIDFGGTITIYPRRRSINEDALDFSELWEKLPEWQVAEIYTQVVEYCNSDAWWGY